MKQSRALTVAEAAALLVIDDEAGLRRLSDRCRSLYGYGYDYEAEGRQGWPDDRHVPHNLRKLSARLLDTLDLLNDAPTWTRIAASGYGSNQIDRLDAAQEAIADLYDHARIAAHRKSRPQHRPRENDRLRPVIRQIAHYWEHNLRRPFSQSFKASSTRGAGLLVEAIVNEITGGACKPSAVRSVMKEVIATSKKPRRK